MNLREAVKWLDFLFDLKSSLSEMKNSISSHSKEIDVLRQQNLLLLERIGHQNDTIHTLESRLNRLENVAINGTATRHSIENSRSTDALNLPDSLDGS